MTDPPRPSVPSPAEPASASDEPALDLRPTRPLLNVAGFEPAASRVSVADRSALASALHFPGGFAWGRDLMPPALLDAEAHDPTGFDSGSAAADEWIGRRVERRSGAETWVIAGVAGAIAAFTSVSEVDVRGDESAGLVPALALTRMAVSRPHRERGLERPLLAHLLLGLRSREPACDVLVTVASGDASRAWWREVGLIGRAEVVEPAPSPARKGGIWWGRRAPHPRTSNQGGRTP